MLLSPCAMRTKEAPAGRTLIVAGRCIGGDRISHAATRNMSFCAVVGQAAGIAAAISLRTDHDFCALDVTAVRSELQRQGVRIH
jgi:hypothetical protein